jgi:MFS transporter, SP family, solute carrier family 2 (myo-inositol transporter), member 13
VAQDEKSGYNRFLLLVAGLGGLLYGVDVGIIAGALPYLEATSGLNANQLSVIVAAVLLGSVISTLFAGTARGLDGPQETHGRSAACCSSSAFR